MSTFSPSPAQAAGLISIGQESSGAEIFLDVRRALRTELLIQASSGGGKSWLIRRIAEQIFPLGIPHIIIDPEGEFSTLREKFPFLLVGDEDGGADTSARVETAPLLARRILEHRVSAICDLYALDDEQRQLFVARFLTALLDAPKAYWHDTLVTLDEGATFCPERGMGTATSTMAVAAMATRGRKRGLGLIAAMHRLATFRKSTAAEMKNSFIGLTVLDDDQERAAKRLGISRRNKEAFREEISRLPAGQLYATGPAFRRLVKGAHADPEAFPGSVLVRVGGVKTTHPDPSEASWKSPMRPPPPMKDIIALLPKFEGLDVTTAPDDLVQAPAAKRRGRPPKPEKDPLTQLRGPSRTPRSPMRDPYAEEIKELGRTAKDLIAQLQKVEKRIARLKADREKPRAHATDARAIPPPRSRRSDDGWRPGGTVLRMLAFIIQFEPLTWRQVATFAGAKYRSKSFANYKSMLRTRGCIEERGDHVYPTQTGHHLGDLAASKLALSDDPYLRWKSRFGNGKCGEMFEIIVQSGIKGLSRAALADRLGYDIRDKVFANHLSMIRSNGILDNEGRGRDEVIRCVPEIARSNHGHARGRAA